MAILTRQAIRAAMDRGEINISPFNEKQLNPCSYDVRLGAGIKVYRNWTEQSYVPNTSHLRSNGMFPAVKHFAPIDMKKPPETWDMTMDERGFLLLPGVFYLMHTVERVCATQCVPVIDGKSSIGRLGIKIHFTAGIGDPGFDGQYTLEVEVSGPVIVYPNVRIGQIRFFEATGEVEDYKASGHYVGETAVGAVGSRAHKQIEEDVP